MPRNFPRRTPEFSFASRQGLRAVFAASVSGLFVPSGVQVIWVTCTGGGGGRSTADNAHSGAHGGTCWRVPIAIRDGDTLNITVGAAGVDGATGTEGGASLVSAGGAGSGGTGADGGPAPTFTDTGDTLWVPDQADGSAVVPSVRQLISKPFEQYAGHTFPIFENGTGNVGGFWAADPANANTPFMNRLYGKGSAFGSPAVQGVVILEW